MNNDLSSEIGNTQMTRSVWLSSAAPRCGRWSTALFVCVAFASICNAQNYDGSFTNIRVIPGLESTYHDINPFMTPDGLSLFFSSDRSDKAVPEDWTRFDIWVATRESATEPFGEPVNLGSPINTDSTGEFGPQLSDDLLSLYYFAGDGPGTNTEDILVSKRDDLSSPWGEPVSVGSEINAPNRTEIMPIVTADELTMYYSNGADLFQATRASTSDPFQNVTPMSNVNTAEFAEFNLSLSSDGLVMFYTTTRDRLGFGELWAATRESLDDEFDNPVNINEFGLGSVINMDRGAEAGVYISPDWPAHGSKLYFNRGFSFDSTELVEATWNVRLPGDIDADGTVGFQDFLQLSDNFGKDVARLSRGRAYGRGDLDGDGFVQFGDFLILSANFGETQMTRTASVPESSTLPICVGGLALCFAFRRCIGPRCETLDYRLRSDGRST